MWQKLRTYFTIIRGEKEIPLFLVTHQILPGPDSQYKSAFHLLTFQLVYVSIEHIFPNKQVSIETETIIKYVL